MSRPQTTQDLYGEAFHRLDAMHDGVRKFRVEVARVKDVFSQPVSGLCCLSAVSDPLSAEEEIGLGDRSCRPATPRPPVETGLEEFRLTLAALRSITL